MTRTLRSVRVTSSLTVLDELMELRKNRPDLEPFFREDRGGRFPTEVVSQAA